MRTGSPSLRLIFGYTKNRRCGGYGWFHAFYGCEPTETERPGRPYNTRSGELATLVQVQTVTAVREESLRLFKDVDDAVVEPKLAQAGIGDVTAFSSSPERGE